MPLPLSQGSHFTGAQVPSTCPSTMPVPSPIPSWSSLEFLHWRGTWSTILPYRMVPALSVDLVCHQPRWGPRGLWLLSCLGPDHPQLRLVFPWGQHWCVFFHCNIWEHRECFQEIYPGKHQECHCLQKCIAFSTKVSLRKDPRWNFWSKLTKQFLRYYNPELSTSRIWT